MEWTDRGFRRGVSQRHREHVTDWWAEVIGGPTGHTDRHGGYESMLRHHVGLEWGTRPAMEDSRPGAQVVEHAPTPRWGWGVAPPHPG